MPPHPGKSEDYLLNTIKQMQADIKALQTSQQFVVTDQTGKVVTRTGLLPDGTYGIQIQNANGQILLKVTNAGQTFPYTFMPWTSVAATYGFVGASYSEIFRCDFSSSGPRIEYDIQADNAGGTMDWQITIAEFGAAQFSCVEQINASGQYNGHFTIPTGALLSGTDPQGRVMSLRINGRRTSGGGTPTLRLNGPCYNRPA